MGSYESGVDRGIEEQTQGYPSGSREGISMNILTLKDKKFF